MNLDKIMNLNNGELSLKYIENLLENYGKKDEGYYTLVYKKSMILSYLDKNDETILFLKEALVEDVSEYTINLYTYLIELLLEANDLENALKYIDIKKTILSLSDYKYYFIDMLKLYDKKEDFKKARNVIKELLGSDINNEEKKYCYSLLTKFSIKENDEDEYIENFQELSKLFEEENDKHDLYEVLISKYIHEYEEQEYLKSVVGINELLLNNNLEKRQQIILATLLMKSYVKLNNYKKAAKIEVKYEGLLKYVSNDLKEYFYQICTELYEILNNTTMSKYYQEKLDKSREKETFLIKEEDEPIDFEKVNFKPNEPKKEEKKIEDLILDTKVSNIKSSKKDIKLVSISQMYDKVRNILKDTNLLDTTAFREIFRVTAINLCKNFPIDDIVVFYKQNNNFKGFHYKVQRVYDKKFNAKDIENTISYFTYLDDNEKYIDDLSSDDLNKDIVTNKVIGSDIKVLSLPIYNKKLPFGSISYFSKKRFIDQSMAYEAIKTINDILNHHLNFYLEKEEIALKNQKLAFIIDNMSSGIKEESEGLIYLNEKSQEIFDLKETMYEKDFLEILDPMDITPYVNAKRQLINGDVKSIEVNYHVYKSDSKIRVKERMYLNFSDNKITIFSLIDNIEKLRVKEEALTRLAFTNYISKLPSSVKLHKDLKEIKSKKFAIAILNINEFNKYNQLYGLSYADNVIYNCAQILSQLLEKAKDVHLYHLEGDKFALLYSKTNDKRLLNSSTLKLLDNISKKLESLDSKVKVTFSCGIYRKTSNNKVIDVEKILSLANDALYEAKKDNKTLNNIVIYEVGQTKERFINTQIINHISEAITNNLISIDYEQIVDLTKNEAYMYEANANLTNYLISLDALGDILEKEDIKKQLGQYLINMVLLELKSFYMNTNAYFNVIIPIYSSLFLDLEFIDYINGQKIQHEIPSDFINIKLIDDIQLDHNNVKNLKKINLKFFTSNLNNYLLNINDSYLFDIKKYQTNNFSLLKSIATNNNIITYNVDNEGLLNLCLTNEIKYVKGKYFDKKYSITDLINLVK